MSKENNRIEKLERSIRLLQDELHNLLNVAEFVKNKKISSKDTFWECEKCGSRLGIYDPVTNDLRIRYKDFYLWANVGYNGFIKIVCRSCSQINKVRYIENGKS